MWNRKSSAVFKARKIEHELKYYSVKREQGKVLADELDGCRRTPEYGGTVKEGV